MRNSPPINEKLCNLFTAKPLRGMSDRHHRRRRRRHHRSFTVRLNTYLSPFNDPLIDHLSSSFKASVPTFYVALFCFSRISVFSLCISARSNRFPSILRRQRRHRQQRLRRLRGIKSTEST